MSTGTLSKLTECRAQIVHMWPCTTGQELQSKRRGIQQLRMQCMQNTCQMQRMNRATPGNCMPSRLLEQSKICVVFNSMASGTNCSINIQKWHLFSCGYLSIRRHWIIGTATFRSGPHHALKSKLIIKDNFETFPPAKFITKEGKPSPGLQVCTFFNVSNVNLTRSKGGKNPARKPV